jgi:tetratricopeptide (TPR) repeat protein
MKQHATAFPFSRPQHDPVPTPRGLRRLLFVTLCLSLAQPFPAAAQTSASAPLPSAAQEAVNKGILAAKVPDYLLAIRYFEEARKLAPQAPVIYLNLGLAESKIPGRELRAMAWFGAYLSAYPGAPNAAAVKEQIAVLEVRNQSNVSRLIKAAQDAVNQMPGDIRESHLSIVAWLWGRSGDVNAALNAIDFIRNNREKDDGLRDIAGSQADLGDIAGAQKAADLIQSVNGRDAALDAIGRAQADDGDIVGAQKTIALIQGEGTKKNVLIAIAGAQAKSGDIESALKTADLLIQDEKAEAVLRKYEGEGDWEDRDGNQSNVSRLIMSLQNAAIQNPNFRDVAKLWAEVGDITAAHKAANLTLTADWKRAAQTAIAEAQIKGGDVAGAQMTS